MKIIIAGTREFDDFPFLKSVCDYLINEGNEKNPETIEIVSGCAKGADMLGERYARVKGYKIKPFPAPWDDIKGKPQHEIGTLKGGKKYWKLAGHFRNEEMAKYADAAIIFWDGRSSGTRNMIQMAEKHKLFLKVSRYTTI